jgi:AcrR family transcriptional regulator
MKLPGRSTFPAPGRRERRKRETRALILAEAAKLFAARGVEASTVEELAEVADVSRATFFIYFSGKPAVVAELADAMATASSPTWRRCGH